MYAHVRARLPGRGLILLLAWLGAACDDPARVPVPAKLDPVAAVARIATEPIAYPLKGPTGQRHLLDATGAPLLLHGEAAWSLVAQLDLAAAELYLEDRRRMGFNAIYVSLIEHAFSDQTPAWNNRAGEPPFSATLPGGQLDLTKPNEAYWHHVDRVLALAHEKNMVVMAFPAYVGYGLGDQGWGAVLAANGPERSRRYGAWLGRRYAGQPNIIWALGGDWRTTTDALDITAEVDALAEGLRGSDPVHLMTAHSHRGRSALDDYDRPWLDLNATYGAYIGQTTIPALLRRDHERSPVMPFFLIEGHYENEHGMTTAAIRAQAYWAMLGGAFGHFYGSWPIWSFGSGPEFGDDKSLTWQEALRLEGAQDMVHLGDLLRSRPMALAEPDSDHAIMTSGYGNLKDASFAACARVADGGSLMAYLPDRRDVTIDLAKVSGPEARAWWFDPRDGTAREIGRFPTTGPREFQPPADGDWVLVIDDAARGFPAPGSGLTAGRR